MRRIIVLSIAVVVVSVVAYFVWSKSGTPTIPVQDQSETEGPVRKVIGVSVEGRNIDAYIYGNGLVHLLFVGGVHGGYEWNSVYLAYKLIDYLDAYPSAVPESLSVTVIPSANPDGLFRVVKKAGRFTLADVSTNAEILESGRFNAREVDLNRNFDCEWQPKSTWQSKTVSAGNRPFSEPEALAIKNYILEYSPEAVIFWHSQSGYVYASHCENVTLPETLNIMNVYSRGSGYPTAKTFDSYDVTGDAEGWLASIKIPAITVELTTHETIEWEKNLAGVKALFEYYNSM